MHFLSKQSDRAATHKLPLKVKLMPHQQAMVYQMLQIEKSLITKENAYAMMSDKPGAGKTYAILAMLYITNQVIFKDVKPHVNLIVVPYNICTQWKQSMEAIYGGSGELIKYKVLTEYSDMMSLYIEPQNLLQYDVLLTTSLYFDTIANTLRSLKLKIQRVFFDEADTIKSLLSTPLECSMTWFVSASIASLFTKGTTKVDIGNYNLELPRLQKYNVCCEPDFINEHIVLPDPIVHELSCANVYHDLLLHLSGSKHYEHIESMDFRFLRSEFVSAAGVDSEFKACNFLFQDAKLKEKRSRELIPSLEKDYRFMVSRDMKEHARNVKEQIEKHLDIISQAETIQQRVEAFKIKYDMVEDDLEPTASPSESKLDIIKDILLNKMQPNDQAILFTNQDGIYSLLRPFLRQHDITFRDLDGGNIELMDAIIGAYKRKECRLLLADSSMYSCGMNLENTNAIIFVHKLDELREKQVIGRAHRYGRDAPLNIYYMNYRKSY